MQFSIHRFGAWGHNATTWRVLGGDTGMPGRSYTVNWVSRLSLLGTGKVVSRLGLGAGREEGVGSCHAYGAAVQVLSWEVVVAPHMTYSTHPWKSILAWQEFVQKHIHRREGWEVKEVAGRDEDIVCRRTKLPIP